MCLELLLRVISHLLIGWCGGLRKAEGCSIEFVGIWMLWGYGLLRGVFAKLRQICAIRSEEPD